MFTIEIEEPRKKGAKRPEFLVNLYSISMLQGRDVTELPAAIFSKQKPGNKAGRPDNSKHR